MSLLFEYGDWHPINKKEELKTFLRGIWRQRISSNDTGEDQAETIDNKYQPFLQFDDNQIRATNYVGFIQHNDELIEIYPKVFRAPKNADKNMMLRHIFYWFSYCRKWRFPFTQATLDSTDIDRFPELIIHLMANQFLDIVSQHPLMQYQPIEESLRTPRGSINFNRYITNSLTRAGFHILECDHEPFAFDNKVNRTIKYCARLLLAQSRLSENQRLLQETIFVLDEVEDIACTIEDANSVSVNAFYEDYKLAIVMCQTIIAQQLYSNRTYDLSQWSLLFPMEYIFEDFIAGFLQTHFSEGWKVEYQKSDEYLSNEPKAFNLQHDIFLTERKTDRQIIVDTKYKLRAADFKNDNKKGVAQDDLYQVLAYAYKRGCTEIILIYPNISETIQSFDKFLIRAGFSGKEEIKVTVMEIPFWSLDDFQGLNPALKNALGFLLT